MLDTGIDVPEVVNLVFFKKVMSKAKFWQMIGRGTRLCPGLLDGEDKKEFYIFDFCGNFEFFRMNKGKASANITAIQGAIFNLKFEIVWKLQAMAYQTEELKVWRSTLVDELVAKVKELDRSKFDVRQHLKFVDLYSNPENYVTLTSDDCSMVKNELTPLIQPDEDEISAVRFDALMYQIELAYLMNNRYMKGYRDLTNKVKGISNVANIPEIQVHSDLINKILHTDYLDNSGINEFEEIREKLRSLMKYLPKGKISKYDTNFEDDILSIEWHESELNQTNLENYKAKIEYYIKQHQQDNPAIIKLKSNEPLNSKDLKDLEYILWIELGTQQDYYSEFGDKPLGEFVREIVGLDMNAAKGAFAEYLDDAELNSNQIYFVNQIIEYIVRNGMLKDPEVLKHTPFTDKGTILELFGNDLNMLNGIQNVIKRINSNALS